MGVRFEYKLSITLNQRKLTRVIIDQHYKLKHSELTDELILKLVKSLDYEILPVEDYAHEFEYLVVEPVLYETRPYRLILVLCKEDDYLGVVNAFRVRRMK